MNLPQLFRSSKKTSLKGKKYPKYILAIIGFLAGFVSGLTGAVGLLFNRFYLSYGMSKEQIVATRAANEIFLHFIKLIIYIILGLYTQAALLLGLTIAVASVLSSVSVKYILPHISENIFKKIGYAAMVISGVFLLSTTISKIANQNHFHYYVKYEDGTKERKLVWSESTFSLEYTINDWSLEIERPIKADELPDELRIKYDSLQRIYDNILLEKVFKIDKQPIYEFYCIRNDIIDKMEFE